MAIYLESDRYEFPYVWIPEIKENIFSDISKSGFNQLHIKGHSGVGKSRCLFEVVNFLNGNDDIILIEHSSEDEKGKARTVQDLAKKIILENDHNIPIQAKDTNITTRDICDLIVKISSSKHVVIALDDLHYKDDLRDSFIDSLIYSSEDTACNITLITTSRNSFNLMRASNFRTISLENLCDDDAISLINYGCRSNPTLKMLRKNILEESKGNPLYISEAMNIVLQANKDPFLALNPSNFFKISNIDDLYEMLLSTLNGSQQEILKAASTIGKTFSYDQLVYLLPYYKEYMRSLLEDLCKKRILRKTNFSGVYAFVHDKQLKSIYKNIPANEKYSWHLALFEEYKKLKQYDLCGDHLYDAHKYDSSIPYLTYTARKLLKNAQPKKAEQYFLRAFEAMEKSDLTSNDSFFKLKMDYCQSLVMQGEANKLRPIIDELKKHSMDDHLLSSILKIEIPFKWISNEYDRSYVLNSWNFLPDSLSFITEKLRLLGMLIDMGCYEEAKSRIQTTLNNIIGKNVNGKNVAFIPLNIILHSFLANISAQQGETKNMHKLIELCLKDIKKVKNPAHKIYGLAFCAKALQSCDLYKQAQPLIEEAYQLNQSFKIGIVTPDILSIYADSLANRGEFIKAFLLFDNLMDMVKAKGNEANKPLHLTLQANAYYQFGIKELSISLLLSAINLAEKQGNLYQESYASYVLAKIYFENNNIEDGKLYSSHAKRISTEIGTKLLTCKIDDIVRKHVYQTSSQIA